MKTFEVDVNINGKITFEVQAHNKKEAQSKVDELHAISKKNTTCKSGIKYRKI